VGPSMKAVTVPSPYGASSSSCHHYNNYRVVILMAKSKKSQPASSPNKVSYFPLLYSLFPVPFNNNFDSLFFLALLISSSSMPLYPRHMHDSVSVMLTPIYQLAASMYMAGDVKTIRFICGGGGGGGAIIDFTSRSVWFT